MRTHPEIREMFCSDVARQVETAGFGRPNHHCHNEFRRLLLTGLLSPEAASPFTG
jgi:hypothetical protein